MKPLTFIEAKATDTRLMGVVGVVAKWMDSAGTTVVQVYHLDFEGFGIDGFHHIPSPSDETLEAVVQGVTGGLGGTFRPISQPELEFLILEAYHQDERCTEALVDFEWFEPTFERMQLTLSESEILALFRRLSPELSAPVHRINYFMMRWVGRDFSTFPLFLTPGALHQAEPLFGVEYTLIKNTVYPEKDGMYRAEALVDFETQYQLVVVSLKLSENGMIESVRIKERMSISSIEAAFNLSKPEFMTVSLINDAFFERKFTVSNPEMVKYIYDQGRLYIEFNRDNGHVAENPYYLNGDIYALYFFSKQGQLIVCSMKPEHLKEIDDMLTAEGAYAESLQFVCEIKTDEPVLYSFLQSGTENFFDFLSNGR